MLEVADLLFAGDELQALGNALVRCMVKVAVVPAPEACGIGPIGDEPDFLGPLERAEHFHPHEAGLAVHEVRASAEGCLHFGGPVIGDDEFAERDKGADGRGDGRMRPAVGAARIAILMKRTMAGGRTR